MTEIQPATTVWELTERHPETIQVLVESGLPKIRDPDRRRTLGRSLTLEAVARLKQLDLTALIDRLTRAAEASSEADVTLEQASTGLLPGEADVRVSGLLPCPVRLPILEALQGLARQLRAQDGPSLAWSLAAASVGADTLNREIAAVQAEDDLPDLFISAGFESFFDQRNLRRFKDRGVFRDLAPAGQNACFGDLELRDPDGHFTMLAVVPAVFLVNHSLLGDDPAPRTWQDLLDPRFARRVALPVGDFDLFNGILLNLYRLFGPDGVRALARNMLVSLHPSQTVGRFSHQAQAQPAVSVVPYFFSKMTMKSRVLTTVWPEDGAIISPIFMLVRRAALPAAEPVARLFLSREVGEVLAHRGLFPAVSPEVDNRLANGAGFHWLGWDFIRDHDLGQLIPELDGIFKEAAA